MESMNGEDNLKSRIALYHNFDVARQLDLEKVADRFEEIKERLAILEADLADEKETRQNWRRRAQDAELTLRRSQFILVLVDGDGYIFKETYLRDAHDFGGARAAHELCTEVHDYLREHNLIDSTGPDMEIMINVYANRSGLAKHLYDADVVQSPNQLDYFFQSFTQSKALIQFIDCGYGKERADAKLRDTYRFFAYNAHCKHIFLACCHDNGYVAELDKYRHDPIAAPKTLLVHSAQMGRGYNTLNFPVAHLKVFNTNPQPTVRKEVPPPTAPTMPRMPSVSATDNITSPAIGEVTPATTPSTWSAIMASSSQTTAPTPPKKNVKPVVAATAPPVTSPQYEVADPGIAHTKGIPVNRQGQRIDLKMIVPTSQDLDAFEDRISNRKLCNRHHLSNDCYTYNCRYDHDPIDARIKTTLRFKARSIPCQSGPMCRDLECFYGHQCPWGRDKCTNPKCGFVQKGMHNISDTDVAKYVPAEA